MAPAAATGSRLCAPAVMIAGGGALVVGVEMRSSEDRLAVTITDGARRGTVSWDRLRCTYRAVIELVPPRPMDGSTITPSNEARSLDGLWDWVVDSQAGVLPGHVILGNRLAEILTVDSLVHRLAGIGFRVDQASTASLLMLRREVERRWGSVTFHGRVHPADPSRSAAGVRREIVVEPADGWILPVLPRFDHPDHGFGWGRLAEATMRTASVLVDLAWSTDRDPATEAAVVDLAVSVLAEVRGDFVWRAESVADWIAGSGELVEPPRHFEQLCFEFHRHP